MAGYYSATQQHRAAAPLADFLTAAYTMHLRWRRSISMAPSGTHPATTTK